MTATSRLVAAAVKQLAGLVAGLKEGTCVGCEAVLEQLQRPSTFKKLFAATAKSVLSCTLHVSIVGAVLKPGAEARL